MINDELAILILAAGASTRMGQPKQLLPILGKPLLVRSAEAAMGAGTSSCIVVLGDNEPAHRKAIEHLSVKIIHHADWHLGMGSTLKVGLNHALASNAKLEGVIIMVCDQPLVSDIHLKNLIEKAKVTEHDAVSSFYKNVKGVPALFKKSLFAGLLSIDATQGARKILNEIQSDTIDFPGGEIDLDTPEDYQRYTRQTD